MEFAGGHDGIISFVNIHNLILAKGIWVLRLNYIVFYCTVYHYIDIVPITEC